jgi:hypothetical protein
MHEYVAIRLSAESARLANLWTQVVSDKQPVGQVPMQPEPQAPVSASVDVGAVSAQPVAAVMTRHVGEADSTTVFSPTCAAPLSLLRKLMPPPNYNFCVH